MFPPTIVLSLIPESSDQDLNQPSPTSESSHDTLPDNDTLAAETDPDTDEETERPPNHRKMIDPELIQVMKVVEKFGSECEFSS